MAAAESKQGDVFDVDRIGRLVELMNQHDLTELDLREGDVRVRIRKGYEPMVSVGEVQTGISAAPAPVAPLSPPVEATSDDALTLIKSPMVGTFYAAPNPDAPPYVKVGDHINGDTIMCIVEAMKVFNEIPAETSGKVVAVLVDSGEPVEFGQPLFKIDPRQ